MLKSNNVDWDSITNLAIARQIGDFIKNIRLQRNLTQSQVAIQSGLNRSTISEVENGRPASFMSFIQILRTLGQLELLDVFTVVPGISPLQMAKIEAKKRRRASKSPNNDSINNTSEW